jgi:hypothetical protein
LPRLLEYLLLCGLAGWLLVSALLVGIEYYDGYDAICNAAAILRDDLSFNGLRAPLMALLLVPAEHLKQTLALHPLDVRPHHLTMAILHTGYVLVVYGLLVRRHADRRACLWAFVACVPSFVFFSYAPFISHDILPGAILLSMVVLSDAFHTRPRASTWLLLVLLGAVGPLIKQTYALFWGSVLVAQLVVGLFGTGSDRPHLLARWASLVGGAVASGAVAWLGIALSLGSAFPDVPFLSRPVEQIDLLFSEAGSYNTFPPWIYLRNLPAYGSVTLLLLVPGLVMALRGSRLQRAVALNWILLFAAMHLLWTREVRYIAFLAPLSAFLLVPPLRALLRRTWSSVGVLVLVLFNLSPLYPYSIAAEASRVFEPFYRQSEAARFLGPLGTSDPRPAPVLVNWNILSFAPPRHSPLAGDRYHRLFHFGRHHLGILFDYAPEEVVLASPAQLRWLWPADHALVLISQAPLMNSDAWLAEPPIGKYELEQALFLSKPIQLTRQADGRYEMGGGTVALTASGPPTSARVAIEGERLGSVLGVEGLASLHLRDRRAGYPLVKISSSAFLIAGLSSVPPIDPARPALVQTYEQKQQVKYAPEATSGSRMDE